MKRQQNGIMQAVNVLGVEPQESETATAVKGIEAMEGFYRAIGMPTSLRKLGIELTEEQVLELAAKCRTATPNGLGTVKRLSEKDMANIYRAAR